MKTFGKMPDDPFYEDINPYLKVWLYESWLHEKEQESESLRNQAIFIGSFSNPEMAQKIIKIESPDYKATDLDETSKMIHEQILEEEETKNPGRNRRKKKKRRVVE